MCKIFSRSVDLAVRGPETCFGVKTENGRPSLCLAVNNRLCGRPPQCPRPCKLTFAILTLKVVFESRDVGHFCGANFSLSRPLSSRLRPDIGPIRQTDVSQTPSCLTTSCYTLLFCIFITFKKCILYFACHSAKVIEKSI